MREWVLVSPHRTDRPWQGQVEGAAQAPPPVYDPQCYLCPGNQRAGNAKNPYYAGTFVFDNDFAALLPATMPQRFDEQDRGLLRAETESGICRVVCFSPRHDLTLARMSAEEAGSVVEEWARQHRELAAHPDINYVEIFENRGVLMGASNPHPHGQIWATRAVPDLPAREQAAQQEYARHHAACLLCEYIEIERRASQRIVLENEHFVVAVPFWAVWPFETIVIPARHISSWEPMTEQERAGLADALRRITAGYDRLFGVPFPYSMGFHQSPCDGAEHNEWHLHAHFYPPLLRSATVRKFMVGFEMLAMPQRDITAEQAAERLREAADNAG